MNTLCIDVYSHYFRVSDFGNRGKALIFHFLKDFRKYEMQSDGHGGLTPVLAEVYTSFNHDKTEFRFPISVLEVFKDVCRRAGFLEADLKEHTHTPVKPVMVDFTMNPKYVAREEDQVPFINYLLSPGHAKMGELQTGKGKTVCACLTMVELRYRTLMTIKPMYIQKWIEDFGELLGLTEKDLTVIEGGEQLRKLMKLAKEDKIKDVKVIIVSNATMRNYIDGFERSELAAQTYDVRPENLHELLGIGLGLVDEFHQDFHFNFRMDLYRNIHKTIELSATVKPDDPFMMKMYSVKFPKGMRYGGVQYDKYIDTYACFFSLASKREVKYLRRGRQSYSHVDFEKSVLKNRKVFANYKFLIKQVVEGYFINDYQPGQRLLVFASTIEMCTELTKYFKEVYPLLIVKRKCDKDPYENVRTADICVSTPGSAGTAIDIPDLVDVCNTVAIGSRQANEQLLGRLRKVKRWPGRVPRLFYFTCIDIQAHLTYHATKKLFFADKVARQNTIRLKGAL